MSFKQIKAKKDAQHAQQLAESKEALNGYTLSPSDQDILNADVDQITSNIQNGKWTAVKVIKAYTSHALLQNDQFNFITEYNISQALSHAQSLDDGFLKNKKLVGPLHGVPVSVKDTYYLKGFDTTTGLSGKALKPLDRDSYLVDLIRSYGGIILFKTNIPQGLLAFECSNPLFGTSVNPYNKELTCGGSSGGEGVSLATRSSLIGFGSDIGGSLRFPAHFCGIYSLKPSAGRFPLKDSSKSEVWSDGVPVVTGPMARSVKDLASTFKLVINSEPWNSDPTCINIPFKEIKPKKQYRVGYYLTDEVILTSPACQRAVKESVQALEREGHVVQPFTIPDGGKGAVDIFVKMTGGDGYRRIRKDIGKDPLESNLYTILLGPRIPQFIRSFLGFIISYFIGDAFFAKTMSESLGRKSIDEFLSAGDAREHLKAQFFKEFDGLDFIICPPHALPAFPHGTTTKTSVSAVSCFLYNVLNYSVGILPVTKVDPAKDKTTPEWRSMWKNKAFGLVNSEFYTSKTPAYDVEKMKGAPVGIQVVGRQHREEEVLVFMQIIEDALKKNSK